MKKCSRQSCSYAGAMLIFATLCVYESSAQVTAQWRGEKRDGIYDGGGLIEAWTEKKPSLIFTIKGLGNGYSSPAVTSDRIYATGFDGTVGYLHAFDLSGKPVWKTTYGKEWNRDYPGVRGTPTVEGNRIYLESGVGVVLCFDAATGKKIWSVDMAAVFGAQLPEWGHNESVLIHGNLLICTPGGNKGSVAALDKATGKTVWTTGVKDEISGYCSPVIFSHKGKNLLVTMLSKSIVGINPVNGKLLWKHPHPTNYGVNANTPIYHNGNVIYFSGYGEGAGSLSLSDDGLKVKSIWTNRIFDIQIGGAVLISNSLYGSGHESPDWHCLDVATGKITYSSKEINRGCVVSAGGLLYCYSESGDVTLMKPESDKFVLKGTVKISDGKGPHWAHPVISGKMLFIRHGDVILVYSLAA